MQEPLRHLVQQHRLSRTEIEGQINYTATIRAPVRHSQIMARRSAQAVLMAVEKPPTNLQLSPKELKAAILLFYALLDEQQRRLFAGLESLRLGHGGDTLLADFLGLDAHTVARGRQQLLDQECAHRPHTTTRRGPPTCGKKTPDIIAVLQGLLGREPRAIP